jgi:hypothetical protein
MLLKRMISSTFAWASREVFLESDGNRGVGSNSSDDYDEMSMF